MVKFFSTSTYYPDSFPTCALAFFLRYTPPSPFTSHILSVDVLSRSLHPHPLHPSLPPILHTTRLILKRGNLPSWAPRSLMSRSESWTLEESAVDVHGQVLRSRTSNIDHTRVMRVVESVDLRGEGGEGTTHETRAKVLSTFGGAQLGLLGFGVGAMRKKVENWAVGRFRKNLERSRNGFSLILSLLRSHRAALISGAPAPLLALSSDAPDFSTPSPASSSASSDADPGGIGRWFAP